MTTTKYFFKLVFLNSASVLVRWFLPLWLWQNVALPYFIFFPYDKPQTDVNKIHSEENYSKCVQWQELKFYMQLKVKCFHVQCKLVQKKKKKSCVCWQNSGQSVELIVCLFDVLTMFCMHGVEVKPERPDWDSLSRGGTEVGSGRSCRQQISGSGDEVSWWERRGAEGWMAAADWLKVNGWEEKKRPVASASC